MHPEPTHGPRFGSCFVARTARCGAQCRRRSRWAWRRTWGTSSTHRQDNASGRRASLSAAGTRSDPRAKKSPGSDLEGRVGAGNREKRCPAVLRTGEGLVPPPRLAPEIPSSISPVAMLVPPVFAIRPSPGPAIKSSHQNDLSSDSPERSRNGTAHLLRNLPTNLASLYAGRVDHSSGTVSPHPEVRSSPDSGTACQASPPLALPG
jgi:hypothetical protein